MSPAPTCLESLNAALGRAMEEDERVLLLGEDLLDPYGGAFKVARGLSTRFPGRVWSTPICEASIVGLAAGLALRGFRPVAEIMFGDFLFLAADQIINHLVKFPAMYNGAVEAPVVVRTPVGGGRGYGPTHSQSPEKHFLGTPGLTIVAPSCFHDAGRLLEQAIRDPGPVLFLEHKLLYPMWLQLESASGLIREEVAGESGYPTVRLRNYEQGKPDATLITYGGCSRHLPGLLEEFRREEIRLLAAIPALLQPVPEASLLDAARDGLRVVVAEEGTQGFGWGAELAARIHGALHPLLPRPVVRLTSAEGVVPAAEKLEEAMLISSQAMKNALLGVLS
jgi:acetoin:2,6-dichlorophenolindophenol oxidoreductase subunit beta